MDVQSDQMRAEPAPHILKLAKSALASAKEQGLIARGNNILTVVDYTDIPIYRRLWVMAMWGLKEQILFNTFVAHGENSGGYLKSTRFPHVNKKWQHSIGCYKTLNSYHGHLGLTLRLQPLEETINDHANDKSLILHGAKIDGQTKTHHAWGCFCVPEPQLREMVDMIKNGSMIVAYAPDKYWLENSKLLKKITPTQKPDWSFIQG